MTVAASTFDAVSSWRAASNKAAWEEANPSAWQIVKNVLRLREQADERKRKH